MKNKRFTFPKQEGSYNIIFMQTCLKNYTLGD